MFFCKNTVREGGTRSLLQKGKRESAISDVSKKLFPDKEKSLIATNAKLIAFWTYNFVLFLSLAIHAKCPD